MTVTKVISYKVPMNQQTESLCVQLNSTFELFVYKIPVYSKEHNSSVHY